MKILVLHGMVPPDRGGEFAGGAALVAWNLSREYAAAGHEVSMLPLHACPERTVDGVHVLRNERSPADVLFAVGRVIPRVFRELRSIWRRVRLPSSPRAEFARLLWQYTKYARILAEPWDVIHLHGHTLPELAFLTALSRTGMRPRQLIVTSHGVNHIDPAIVESFKSYNLATAETKCLSLARTLGARFSAVSSRTAKQVSEIVKVEVETIINGVSEVFFQIERKPALGDRARFISVGTISPRKNQELALRALALVKRTSSVEPSYTIVGSGSPDYVASLRSLSLSLGLTDVVRWRGELPQDKLVELYGESDWLLLPSTSEAFALVSLEAAAAGLGIVTMRNLEGVAELKDLVKDGRILECERYEPESFAESIRAAMAKGASEGTSLMADVSWKSVASRYLRLFDGGEGSAVV